MSPTAERELRVKILGDSKGVEQAFKNVESKSGALSGTLGKLGAAFAGAFAVDKVVGFVKGGIDALANMDRLISQTQAVVKSTGSAAKVTAKQVEELGNAIEKTTGVEAENVIQGQNMLLTFTNIRNGVGKGNDVFNQATKILVDMSVAMGSDTQSAAIQLGKALNDPIKGITALSKVGVTFDEGQKKQIETMVKMGDTAGAQKVILAELNKEFGGSAEAFGGSAAGKIAKFKNELGNLQENIASYVLPTLIGVTTWLTDHMGPAFDKVRDSAANIKGSVTDAATGLQGFVDGLKPMIEQGDWKGVGEAIGVALGNALDGAGSAAKTLGTKLGNLFGQIDWVGIGISMGKQAPALLLGLAAGILNFDLGSLLSGIGDHWKDILIGIITLALTPTKFLGPIGKVLEKLPFGSVLSSALFKAVDISKSIVGFGARLAGGIGEGFLKGLGFFPGAVKIADKLLEVVARVDVFRQDMFAAGGRLIKGLPDGMIAGASKITEAVVSTLKWIFDAYKDAGIWLLSRGTELITGLTTGVRQSASFLFDYFLYIPRKIIEVLAGAGTWLIEHGKMLIGGLKGGMDFSIVDVWRFFYETLPQGVIRAVSGAASWLMRTGGQILEGLLSGTQGVFSGQLVPFFSGLGGRLKGYVGDVASMFKSIGEDIIRGIISGLDNAKDAVFNKMKDIAGGALSAAKDKLGINSPSRVFRDVVGVGIGEGVIVGIDKMRGPVAASVARLVNPAKALSGTSPASIAAGIKSGGVGSYFKQALGSSGSYRPSGDNSITRIYNVTAPGAYAEPLTEEGMALLLRRTELMYG